MVIADIKAQDYFLSFSFTTENNEIFNYQINFSKALTNSDIKKIYLFKIPCSLKIEECLKQKKDQIIQNLLKHQIEITSSFFKNKYNYQDEKSKIVYLPKRFDLIKKNGYLYFFFKGEK